MSDINPISPTMHFHQNRLKYFASVGLLMTFLSVLPSFAADQAVILRGNYAYASYRGNQAPVFTSSRDFTVMLAGCSWIISYTNSSDGTARKMNPHFLMTVASCDGTNLFIIDYPAGNAEVWNGTDPCVKDGALRDIWFAFASRGLLSGSEGITKPLFSGDLGIYMRDDYNCRYRWTTKSDGTPESLTLTDDGTYLGRDHLTGRVIHDKFPSPYSAGFTLAVGQWASATNIDGTIIPTDFQLAEFSPRANGTNVSDLLKIGGFRCVVTNVTVGDMPKVPGNLPDNASVGDRRFANIGYAYITYTVTNGIWPSINNSLIQQYLVNAPRFTMEEESLAEMGIKMTGDTTPPDRKQFRQETAKWIIWLALIFPAIFFCVRTLKTTNNKNKV